MAELRVYLVLVRAAVAGQASYRASFALELTGQSLIVLLDLAEVYGVFTQVHSLGGFQVGEVLLIFGLASTSFALADLAVGQLDRVSEHVRRGTLDVLLLRPFPILAQLSSADLQLRRLGRLGASVLVVVAALVRAEVAWTPARLALLAVTPLAGAVIYGAIFVGAGAATFWLVEGIEVTAAFTYGSSYLAQWPFGIFGLPLRRFFTFVIPAAFTGYLPALAILGRPDPTGLPDWMAWGGPLAAAWSVLLAGLCWRAGVRHYVGAGG